MSYRPITDFWFLARPKVAYYGAYPNGFLERARALLGVNRKTPVLHVCGGSAKKYPTWKTLCPNDKTLDLDVKLKPDFLGDARGPLPPFNTLPGAERGWPGIICDPPYTEADATHYRPGPSVLPSATLLLRNALASVAIGGRVGMLHYELPRPSTTGVKFIAVASVVTGYGNRGRLYSVFERLV